MRRILLLVPLFIGVLMLLDSHPLMAQGDLAVEMIGSYSTGTEINLWVSSRSGAVRVDYGDGQIRERSVSTDPSNPTKINSYATEGEPIKLYGRDLTALRCFWNKLTRLTLHAPDLEVLHCHTNQIAELDLTASSKLRIVDATEAGLTHLNISGLHLLDTLVCDGNRLSSLNLTGMNQLKLLECYNNLITQLDLRSCPALVKVAAHKNQLETLDLTGLTALESLSCWRNKIAELDLSSAVRLNTLDCSENRLSKLLISPSAPISKIELQDNQLAEEAFTSFVQTLPDLSGQESGTLKVLKTSSTPPEGNQVSPRAYQIAQSKNWKLYKGYDEIPAPKPYVHLTTADAKEWLLSMELVDETQADKLWIDWNNDGICQENERGMPDAKHSVDAKSITIYGDLVALFCYENDLTELDVTTQSNLQRLSVADNKLTTIDLSGNPLLESLWVQNNQLTQLDLTQQRILDNLNCSNNKLSDITFPEQCPLMRLEMENNQFKTLDLTHTPGLSLLNANGNQLTSFDCSQIPEVSWLKLANNQLVSIDPSGLSELMMLHLYGNKLTTLPLGEMEWLTSIMASNNQISSIDLSGCTELEQLNLSGNPISTIDLKPCVNMSWINLSHCQLSEIDLTSLELLEQVSLAYNNLTELALPKNCEDLVIVDVEGNKIRLKAMQALIDQLPVREYDLGELYVVAEDSLYNNAISTEQVDQVKDKNWQVFASTKSDPKYLVFLGYTMHPVSLTVGEHGSAAIVNYLPYDQVPEGIRLQLEVTPDKGYTLQSVLVNGKPIEGLTFAVTEDTEVQVLFQKGNGITTPHNTVAQIFPNPATDFLRIARTTPYAEIALYDYSGQLLLSTRSDSSGDKLLDLRTLPDGVYYLKISEQDYTLFIQH